MIELLNHMAAMQGMASRFLEPEVYVDRDGARIAKGPKAEPLRNTAFINDMLFMLDGPQEREAVAKAKHFLSEQNQKLGAAEQKAHQAEMDAINLKAETNELRTRLMASELAYAKLRGYVDRMVDEQPPVMVPQERIPMHAQMPDGTFGTSSPDWRQDGSGRSQRHWYHR